MIHVEHQGSAHEDSADKHTIATTGLQFGPKPMASEKPNALLAPSGLGGVSAQIDDASRLPTPMQLDALVLRFTTES